MKKIICGAEYDTAASSVVKKVVSGYYGDSYGYEETLYVTEEGKFFLYTNGGADSKYPAESIKRMSKKAADAWVLEN